MFVRKLLCALFPALLIFLCGSCAKKNQTLSLLVWEGYGDPSYIKAFEEKNHCKVTATYFASSDDLVSKLRAPGASYDVISPSSDVATMIATSGLAAPLDLGNIPSYGQLSPQLTSLSLVRVKGDVYGVPFMWGSDPLLYDTTAFPTPPESWSALWDPKLKGKVSVWDDLATVYMAAQVIGYDKPDPAHLFNLSDQELDATKKKLVELKPNIRQTWSTSSELTTAFQNHEIVIAMGWPLMTNQLRKVNFPIGETIPKENTTGWIDHLMITAGSNNKELAYKFLEFMIQAETQKKVTEVTGYTPANPRAAQSMTPEEQKSLHLDNVDSYQQRLYFLQNVPRRARYKAIWNEVKSAQ